MKISDYLHFYLGCEVMTEQGKGRLSEVHANGDMIVEADNDVDYYEWVKPILRKLSDMMEEEKLKLYGMGFTHNVKGLQIEHPKRWPTFKPIQFQYLISIGIDLFGLIDAGLAIDNKSI